MTGGRTCAGDGVCPPCCRCCITTTSDGLATRMMSRPSPTSRFEPRRPAAATEPSNKSPAVCREPAVIPTRSGRCWTSHWPAVVTDTYCGVIGQDPTECQSPQPQRHDVAPPADLTPTVTFHPVASTVWSARSPTVCKRRVFVAARTLPAATAITSRHCRTLRAVVSVASHDNLVDPDCWDRRARQRKETRATGCPRAYGTDLDSDAVALAISSGPRTVGSAYCRPVIQRCAG